MNSRGLNCRDFDLEDLLVVGLSFKHRLPTKLWVERALMEELLKGERGDLILFFGPDWRKAMCERVTSLL